MNQIDALQVYSAGSKKDMIIRELYNPPDEKIKKLGVDGSEEFFRNSDTKWRERCNKAEEGTIMLGSIIGGIRIASSQDEFMKLLPTGVEFFASGLDLWTVSDSLPLYPDQTRLSDGLYSAARLARNLGICACTGNAGVAIVGELILDNFFYVISTNSKCKEQYEKIRKRCGIRRRERTTPIVGSDSEHPLVKLFKKVNPSINIPQPPKNLSKNTAAVEYPLKNSGASSSLNRPEAEVVGKKKAQGVLESSTESTSQNETGNILNTIEKFNEIKHGNRKGALKIEEKLKDIMQKIDEYEAITSEIEGIISQERVTPIQAEENQAEREIIKAVIAFKIVASLSKSLNQKLERWIINCFNPDNSTVQIYVLLCSILVNMEKLDLSLQEQAAIIKRMPTPDFIVDIIGRGEEAQA